MARQLAKTNGYSILVSKIRKELEGLELLVKQKTVQTYWRVGKYICDDLLENKERADYGKFLLQQLSGDVGVNKKTLERSVKFYRAYPIATNLSQLSWSHFLYLLTVQDVTKRRFLEKQAVSEGWKLSELKRRIEALRQEEESKQTTVVPKLSFTKGKLHCYRLLESEFDLLIDLGFQMRREFPEGEKLGLKAADHIKVIKEGKTFSTEKISISEEKLFTYRAIIEKIIDADTLWALINCDFGILIRQKLRLRGIDCPEVSTPEGLRAKRFVQDRLKELKFIIIKTYKDKTEKYGRYLVDVFYLKEETDPQKVVEEGIFLNQELLDKGLATLV